MLIRDAGVTKLDPWLAPFQDALKRRYSKAQEWIKKIDDVEGGLEKFSKVRCRSRLILLRRFYKGEISNFFARVPIHTGSTSRRITASSIENGLRMPTKHR